MYADCQCVNISISVQIDTVQSICKKSCLKTLNNMAEKAVEEAATRAEMYFSELLLSARGICKGCAETFAALNAHLHRNIVKIYCPAPGCYATTMDTPASIDRHWNKLHASLGPRPRAVRIALRRPKCATRWGSSEDTHRRDLTSAFMDSVAPSAAEWGGMPECRIYQEDGRVGRGVTDAIAFTVDAPPKPTVEELISYGYRVKAWSNRPQPSRPERKYLWKAVSERFPEALVPREYNSMDDTDLGDDSGRTTGFAQKSRTRRTGSDAPRQYRRVTTAALGLPDILEDRQPAATRGDPTDGESVNAPLVEGLARPSVPSDECVNAPPVEGLVTSPVFAPDDECVNAPPVEGLVRQLSFSGDESVNAPTVEGLVPSPTADNESVNAPSVEGLVRPSDSPEQFAVVELDTAAGLVETVDSNLVIIRLPRGQDVVLTRPVILALAENGVEIPVLGLVAVEPTPAPSSPPPLSLCPALAEAAEVIPPLPAHAFMPDLAASPRSETDDVQLRTIILSRLQQTLKSHERLVRTSPTLAAQSPSDSPSTPTSPDPSGTPVRDETPGRDERRTETETVSVDLTPPLPPPVTLSDTHEDAPLEAVIFGSPRRRRRRPRIVSRRCRPRDIVAKAIRKREMRREATNYYKTCIFKRRTRVCDYLRQHKATETERCGQRVQRLRTALATAMGERAALREQQEELLRQERRVEESIQSCLEQLQEAEEARARAAAGCARYAAGWHREFERVFKNL